ncbi:transglycosylase domain-containing protein [Saccharothrix sp. NPDC042600]|uniref:penicillin-binding protein n=1 Tax=Saccharothrix TaxID=2071 RepID=UPI0033FF94A6
MAKLLGLSLSAGLLLAGMVFPVMGSLAVLSGRVLDAVDALSADLIAMDLPLATTVTDAAGAPIAWIYDQYRLPAPADRIAPVVKAAVVAAEDRRFYEHRGVDLQGVARALAVNHANGSVTQGASTLTQQYVKNYLTHIVYRNVPEQQRAAQAPTVERKLREARIAMRLEQDMSKDDILTGYLNVVPYGANVYGIAAAAQVYFGTTPDALSIPQAALLAGMLNRPAAFDPVTRPDSAVARRNDVLDRMVEAGTVTPEDAESYKTTPLGVLDPPRQPPAGCVAAGPADGFFCSYLLDHLARSGLNLELLRTGGFTVRSTLDRAASAAAKQAVEDQVPKATEGIANTMAVVTPGRERHRVQALVANRDHGLDPAAGQSMYDLPGGVANKFGAGSIFKIFTAAAALEHGFGLHSPIPTPASYTSTRFRDGDRPYTVRNSGTYRGSMTLQDALAASPNTGFLFLEEKVGVGPVVEMARKLGLRRTLASTIAGTAPDADDPNPDLRVSQAEHFTAGDGKPSFTFGPAPVSTLELANVAATLVSGGVWCLPTPVDQVLDRSGAPVALSEEPCAQVVPEALAATLVVGLSKDTSGIGTAAAAAARAGWSRPMLGKTGTTESHKSAGFVGATPQLAAAVATFNDGRATAPICDTDPPALCAHGDIFGGKVPARTWFDAMSRILGDSPVLPLPSPDDAYRRGLSVADVPDVVGRTFEEASAILAAAGFGVTATHGDSTTPPNTVTDQSPRGTAPRGSLVTLHVSTGRVAAPAPPPPATPAPQRTQPPPPPRPNPTVQPPRRTTTRPTPKPPAPTTTRPTPTTTRTGR